MEIKILDLTNKKKQKIFYRVKSFLTRLAGTICVIFFGFTIAVLILEIALRASINLGVWKESSFDWNFYVNSYTGDGFECSFQEALEAHPYLGWITGPFQPCGRFVRNNRGFWDRRNIPEQKDPNFFTIIIVGGSVASQFSHGNGDDLHPRYWLEEELNKHYLSPNGKPFRVVSGAMGGWRMPTQIIATTIFGSFVDAVISLDGYNEMLNEFTGDPIDKPDTWTWFSVQNQRKGKVIIRLMRYLKTYRLLVASTPVLRDSKTLFSIFEGLIRLVSDDHGNIGDATTLRFQFSYPENWSKKQSSDANIRKWQNYLNSLRGLTMGLGLKYAHFIQPIPSLGKVLTIEEKKYAQWIKGDEYLRAIINPAEELRNKGFPVESLAEVFINTKETVYHDEIHCGYDADLDSLGYRIMAKSMSESIGRFWNLKLNNK